MEWISVNDRLPETEQDVLILLTTLWSIGKKVLTDGLF